MVRLYVKQNQDVKPHAESLRPHGVAAYPHGVAAYTRGVAAYTHALCLTLAAAVAIAALAAVEPADHVRNSQGLHTDRRR